MLLIIGGIKDPHLDRVSAAAREAGVDLREARFGPSWTPSFTWRIETGEVILAGERIRPRAAFYRRDVFNALNEADPRRRAPLEFQSAAWQAMVRGWVAAEDALRVVNRGFLNRIYSKPLQLVLALRCGLPIPRTTLTNDAATLRALAAGGPCIAKPVDGGQLTMALDEAIAGCPPERETLPAPAFAQNRLVSPEYRVFLVGCRAVAFRIDSPHLDYRADHGAVALTLVDPEAEPVAPVVAPLRRLAERLGLDFCAADFKTDPDTGTLVFLEVNEQPMFARFDRVADGAISRGLVETLMGEDERGAGALEAPGAAAAAAEGESPEVSSATASEGESPEVSSATASEGESLEASSAIPVEREILKVA